MKGEISVMRVIRFFLIIGRIVFPCVRNLPHGAVRLFKSRILHIIYHLYINIGVIAVPSESVPSTV